jgi:hypothetical protein
MDGGVTMGGAALANGNGAAPGRFRFAPVLAATA